MLRPDWHSRSGSANHMRETLKVKPGIGDAMVAPPCPGEPQGLAEKELGAVGPVSRGG